MPTKTIIHDLKRKIPWSFISVALALVFGALTVYQAFFHQKSPSISVEILSNARVLAVRGTKAYGIITAGEVLLSGGTAYSLEMEVISYEDYCV